MNQWTGSVHNTGWEPGNSQPGQCFQRMVATRQQSPLVRTFHIWQSCSARGGGDMHDRGEGRRLPLLGEVFNRIYDVGAR